MCVSLNGRLPLCGSPALDCEPVQGFDCLPTPPPQPWPHELDKWKKMEGWISIYFERIREEKTRRLGK